MNTASTGESPTFLPFSWDLEAILQVLKRYAWLYIVWGILCFAGAFLYVRYQSPRFQGQAKMLIEFSEPAYALVDIPVLSEAIFAEWETRLQWLLRTERVRQILESLLPSPVMIPYSRGIIGRAEISPSTLPLNAEFSVFTCSEPLWLEVDLRQGCGSPAVRVYSHSPDGVIVESHDSPVPETPLRLEGPCYRGRLQWTDLCKGGVEGAEGYYLQMIPRSQYAEVLLQNVRIQVHPTGRLGRELMLSLELTHPSASRVAHDLAILTDAIRQFLQEHQEEQLRGIESYLLTQIRSLQQELNQIQEQIAQWSVPEMGFYPVPDTIQHPHQIREQKEKLHQIQRNLRLLASLHARLQAPVQDTLQLLTEFRAHLMMHPDLREILLPVLQEAQQQWVEWQEARQRWGPAHPALHQARDQWQRAWSLFLQTFRSLEEVLRNEQISLQQQILRFQNQTALQAPSGIPVEEWHRLQMEQELKQSVLKDLLSQLIRVQMLRAGMRSPVQVLHLPEQNIHQIQPRPLLAFSLAFVLSMGMICLHILGMLFFFRKVSTLRDLERIASALSIQMLGSIPWYRKSRKHETSQLPEEERMARESAFSNLASSLMYELSKTYPDSTRGKVILVTSSFPGEGKTFLTWYLSLAIAVYERMNRRNVLLVDGDFRRPRLSEMLRERCAGKAWTDWIKRLQAADVREFITTRPSEDSEKKQNALDQLFADVFCSPSSTFSNVRAILLETPRVQVQELVASHVFGEFLEYLRKKFSWVLLDTAPTPVGPEYQFLLPHVSCILFVVRAGKTTFRGARDTLRAFRQHIPDIPIFVVLNGHSPILKRYGSPYAPYYYYYRRESGKREER